MKLPDRLTIEEAHYLIGRDYASMQEIIKEGGVG